MSCRSKLKTTRSALTSILHKLSISFGQLGLEEDAELNLYGPGLEDASPLAKCNPGVDLTRSIDNLANSSRPLTTTLLFARSTRISSPSEVFNKEVG